MIVYMYCKYMYPVLYFTCTVLLVYINLLVVLGNRNNHFGMEAHSIGWTKTKQNG